MPQNPNKLNSLIFISLIYIIDTFQLDLIKICINSDEDAILYKNGTNQ